MSLGESMTDLPNRYYRYPAARVLLAMIAPITAVTPNRVTYAHTVVGLSAAGLVGFTDAHWCLVVAFVLLEVRIILDCLDGELARARGTSSPLGRAIDEIGDTISSIALHSAMAHRAHLGGRGVLLATTLLAVSGLCANGWDFYKRKITFAIRDNRDGTLAEIRAKKARLDGGGAKFLDYWSLYFDAFQILLYEARPSEGDAVEAIRARAGEPAFRRFTTLLAFLSYENGLTILHFGVLTGLFAGSMLLTLAYATTVWLATMLYARAVFGNR